MQPPLVNKEELFISFKEKHHIHIHIHIYDSLGEKKEVHSCTRTAELPVPSYYYTGLKLTSSTEMQVVDIVDNLSAMWHRTCN